MEITTEIKDRLEQLSKKYAAIGQDLVSYLDGLIYANPITYWDYIEVDALLSLQKPKTDFPDEKIFIVYHQITELYFSLILHELDQVCHNGKIISEAGQDLGWNDALDCGFFIDRLKRINMYFETLTQSFEVMRFGMEKDQFTKFRMSLLSSSGFQTAAYRRIEIACTDLKHLVLEKQREQLKDADIHEKLDNIYWRRGAIVEETGEKALIGAKEIGLMKTGSGIINTARGGIIDEDALMFALDKGKLEYAGLDVFLNEPNPSIHLLMHNSISLTPHIGAATQEAQDRIGTELAEKIITYFEK